MARDWKEHWLDLSLKCDCGHAILNLCVDKIDGEGYWDLYELDFYTLQQPFLSNLKENIRLIWSIIRGKRYCMYGVVLEKNQWQELKDFINSIDVEEFKEYENN